MSWFAVPLEKRRYAVGRVARHSPKGAIILAYFFGPARAQLPSVAEVECIKPESAIQVCLVGDLKLIKGGWPIIGNSENWNRGEWPIPTFTRTDDTTKMAWQIHYSDDDPNVLLFEEKIPYDASVPDTDELFGAEAAEIVLSRILGK